MLREVNKSKNYFSSIIEDTNSITSEKLLGSYKVSNFLVKISNNNIITNNTAVNSIELLLNIKRLNKNTLGFKTLFKIKSTNKNLIVYNPFIEISSIRYDYDSELSFDLDSRAIFKSYLSNKSKNILGLNEETPAFTINNIYGLNGYMAIVGDGKDSTILQLDSLYIVNDTLRFNSPSRPKNLDPQWISFGTTVNNIHNLTIGLECIIEFSDNMFTQESLDWFDSLGEKKLFKVINSKQLSPQKRKEVFKLLRKQLDLYQNHKSFYKQCTLQNDLDNYIKLSLRPLNDSDGYIKLSKADFKVTIQIINEYSIMLNLFNLNYLLYPKPFNSYTDDNYNGTIIINNILQLFKSDLDKDYDVDWNNIDNIQPSTSSATLVLDVQSISNGSIADTPDTPARVYVDNNKIYVSALEIPYWYELAKASYEYNVYTFYHFFSIGLSWTKPIFKLKKKFLVSLTKIFNMPPFFLNIFQGKEVYYA